jgi:hypothetical protein
MHRCVQQQLTGRLNIDTTDNHTYKLIWLTYAYSNGAHIVQYNYIGDWSEPNILYDTSTEKHQCQRDHQETANRVSYVAPGVLSVHSAGVRGRAVAC